MHKILEKFDDMQNCKPISTLVETGLKLSMYDVGDSFNVHTYIAVVVGCLIYSASNTRLDIQFQVSQTTTFMHNPSIRHWQAVKHICHYFIGIFDYALFFPKKR